MKKILFFILMLVATTASAQYYVSVSGGYSIPSSGMILGTSLTSDQSIATVKKGSYGEGFNTQFRAGYFFSKTFGLELGFAYLHGDDQNVDSYRTNVSAANVTSIVERTKGTAHARAYGLNLALIYNFNDNIYGKFGAITKIAGATKAEFVKTTNTAFGPIIATGKIDYSGRLPLGFTASIGYKHKISSTVSLFAELEYLGINLTRDSSEYTKLAVAYPAVPQGFLGGGQPAQTIPAYTWQLGQANHPVFPTPTKDIEYVDSLDPLNKDQSKSLTSIVPYSSFGLNIGVIYSFGK
jgi:hypothetical protein